MRFLKYILLGCMLPIFSVACTPPNNPDPSKAIDSNAELVAACRHIEGCGAAVTGGDGGAIYRVTRLDDAIDPNTGLPMAGTLRYAVSQTGARRVLFMVSGTIHLTSELRIKMGSITIDGQSAPGEGICIADYPLVINASNVIVRFLRVRLGDVSNTESDAVSVNNATGVVLDHLSCSWSVDECVSCYGNTNFTMQYCFITESLRNSVHGKGNHGYGGIWGGENATFHHNLLAHHDSRNPRFDHDYVNHTQRGPIDFVNNVVYNWGSNSAYGGESVGTARTINFVANYFKPGPATKDNVKTRLVNPWTSCDNCTAVLSGKVVPPQLYLADNYMYGSPEVTADNWKGATTTAGKVTQPFAMSVEVKAETAEQAFETVLAKGGCSLHRDVIDERIVSEVRAGNYTYNGTTSKGGLIDTQSDVGGWPELSGAEAVADKDYDGIPDTWEDAYGLDSSNPLDARDITLVTGHTNLDVYLCDLVKHLY